MDTAIFRNADSEKLNNFPSVIPLVTYGLRALPAALSLFIGICQTYQVDLIKAHCSVQNGHTF